MSNDLVRRDDVEKLLCARCKSSFIKMCIFTPDDCRVMEYFRSKMPTVCQEQEWIPCSESLPEPDEEVWTYLPNDDYVVLNWLCVDGTWYITGRHDKPSHWMKYEIPESPKKGDK